MSFRFTTCLDILLDLFFHDDYCLYPCLIGMGINYVIFKEFQSLENDVCHARRCIGHKCPMDEVCSKCKIHCFSHELWNFGKFTNFRKFLKNFFCPNLFFFPKNFFPKNVFSDNFFSKISIAFKTLTLC